MTSNDKKRVARDIASKDPECNYTEEALAEKLGVTQQTVNIWISDIRIRQRTNRNSNIIRLSRLGWTHEKISEKVGLSRNRISEIIGNTNIGNIDTLLAQGHDMEYIAAHDHMDLALAWALRLEGKTDQEKFKELGCPLSSERLTGNMVQRMQDKRILGTIGRTLLIAKKALLCVSLCPLR